MKKQEIKRVAQSAILRGTKEKIALSKLTIHKYVTNDNVTFQSIVASKDNTVYLIDFYSRTITVTTTSQYKTVF